MIVGVLGAGQLGRMLALAGYPLGLRFRFLDPAPEAPAEHMAERVTGSYDDEAVLDRFARGLDVVTYEFENVPQATARFLAQRLPVYPPPAALEVSQDRLVEKTFFQQLDIPTPPFAAVDSRDDLDRALMQIGLPAVLKTRRLGYDGKGQQILRSAADTDRAWSALRGTPLLLEGFIGFDRELSVLAVRGRDGHHVFYPLVENQHDGGILRLSRAPATAAVATLGTQAESYAARVLDRLGYVGVLAIEFFQRDGQLLANEMAPRVHNSGHWTIEGAETSQFENHLRAVLGWPLGATTASGHCAMLNLIGTVPRPEQILAVPAAHLHLYGKSPRPERKLGHITVCADNVTTLDERLARLRAVLSEAP